MKPHWSVQAMMGLLSLASTVAGAQWAQTTSLPRGFAYHSLAFTSGFLYQAGGMSNDYGAEDGTSVFYAQVLPGGMIGAWHSTTALPAFTYYHSSVAANGYVYVLGGENYDYIQGIVFSDKVYYAKTNPDGTLGSWQETTPLPQPVYFFGAAFWSGRIYVLGGYTGSEVVTSVYSATVHTNGSLGVWESQPALPEPIYSHSVAADGALYLVGGVINDGAKVSNKVFFSRINQNGTLAGWDQTTPLPQPLANFGVVEAAGRIFAVGGFNGSQCADLSYHAPVAGDGSVGSWSATGAVLPTAIHDYAVTVTESHIYLSGGADMSWNNQNSVYSMPLPAPPIAPTLTVQGFATNGSAQLKLLSDTNTGFGFQASTNLTDWERIGWGFTGTNGLLFFQDTNAANFPRRFYRTYWPLP